MQIYPGFKILGKATHPKYQDAGYQEYRKNWQNYPKNFIVGSFPLHLDIDITTLCNLQCPMCPRTLIKEYGPGMKNETLPLSEYQKIIDEGVTFGLCAVNLNFLGEPLLHPDLVEMVSYAHHRGILDVMLHTNATLLTEELSGKLIGAGLDQLHLSLDAACAEVYQKIRVGGDFDKVVANICRFRQIRDKKGIKSPLIRAQMVVMQENVGEIDKFKSFWLKFVDAVAIREYRNPLGLDKVNRYVNSEKGGRRDFVCPDLWRRLVINADGVVIPCCRDVGRNMVVGDIYKTSLQEVWLGEKMHRLRAIHRRGLAVTLRGCWLCEYVGGKHAKS